MNTLDMLCNKLRLIARYCSEKRTTIAITGMADISKALTGTMEAIIAHNRTDPKSAFDISALMGSFQLALDAINKKDTDMLMAAVQEGMLPELERVQRSNIAVPDVSGTPDAKTEERIASSASPVTVCLFGYGDGQYYEELCGMAPEGSSFIVFEPEKDTLAEFEAELIKNVSFFDLDNVVVLATPGYDTLFCSEFLTFVGVMNDHKVRLNVNVNTLKRFRDNAPKNVITNLHILKKCNFVDSISSVLPRDIPVIIVSAGPSLDKNIELLKKAKGHCLIFAVDTALKYLMQHDIMPDLAITIEAIKPMANYGDERCFDIPHVFDCESNPEIVSKERERIFIYNCRDYVKCLLEASGIEAPAEMHSGGSVATAAFAICYRLNIKNIILIGQDLAYSGTSTHAGNVESAGLNGDIGTDMVDGIDGNQVRTRSDWLGYLFWFEKMIKLIRDQHLDINVIDATEGGALIHGSHVMTLSDAIEKYCAGCNYVFAEELKRLPYLLDDEEYSEVRERISASFDELAKVREAAQKGSELCDKELSAGRTLQAADPAILRAIVECRRVCEAALLYPQINNYAVCDIADEVSRLRRDGSGVASELQQQKLAFEVIAKACDYFEGLRPE